MGKEKPGFLTPKAIANRIKAKGMQKLRWYCQMCQKQCRDENGFKCHTTSESHQRQLLLFAENQGKFMDEFSGEFNKGYLLTLKRRFGTKRVHANIVYQEYISDRTHIHMNATRWLTLTDYVKWLGRKSLCVVDETEKGWFVTYIDRDPETMRRQIEAQKKKKLELDDLQRQQLFLERQMEKDKGHEEKASEPTELKKSENGIVKINFLKPKPILKSGLDQDFSKISKEIKKESKDENEETSDEDEYYDGNYEDDDEEENEESGMEDENSEESSLNKSNSNDNEFNSTNETRNQDLSESKDEKPVKIKSEVIPVSSGFSSSTETKPSNSLASSSKASTSATSATTSKNTEKRKHSALDEIIEMEEKKREKVNRKDYWLHKNIIVKITTNKLGEKYYKKKGIVMDVQDLYTGVVKLVESGATIKIDQAHLESVLPAIGKQVMILNGAYRGELAVLEAINEKEFSAKVSIATGPLKGRIVNGIQYEDISKYNAAD